MLGGPSPDLKIRGMGKYGLQVGRVLPHLREVVVVVQWSVQSWVVLRCTLYRCTGVPTRVSVNERSVHQSDLAYRAPVSVAPGSSSETM